MDLVRIERFTSRVHAELASSMLAAHGINARVSGDDVAGVHPDIPYGIGGTAVVVPREQLDEANALLDEEFAGPMGDEASIAGDEPRADSRGADDGAGEPDPGWVASGRAAERRPGLRVFAVFTAALMLTIFVSVTGRGAGWW